MRLAALVIAAAVVTACGDDGTASEPTDGVELVPSGSIEVDLAPVELPSELPPDVPLPDALVVEGADVLEGETSTIFDVTGWHDGEPVAAGQAYLTALESSGFEVTSRSDAAESLFFTVEDGLWLVSAGFFPDPVRGVGTSVGLTIGPASAASG